MTTSRPTKPEVSKLSGGRLRGITTTAFGLSRISSQESRVLPDFGLPTINVAFRSASTQRARAATGRSRYGCGRYSAIERSFPTPMLRKHERLTVAALLNQLSTNG